MKLWIVVVCTRVIKGKGGGSVWEFCGVFSSEEKAVAACKSPNYFIGPATLDEEVPDDLQEWPGGYFPIKEAEK